jgi:hypothetical protein
MAAATTANQFPTWEYDLLRALGAPQDLPQLQALNYWAAAEGMPATTNNFLAITDPDQEFGTTGGDPAGALATGVWNYSSNGEPLVVTFASLSSGINALVKFLQAGHTGIVDALRDPNATVQSIAQAVSDDGAWGSDGAAIAAKDGSTIIYRGGSATGVNGDVASLGPSTFYQCNSSNTIIGEGGIVFGIGKLTILNPCQAKAIVGGLIVGVGFIVMSAGIGILATAGVKELGIDKIAKTLSKELGKTQNALFGSKQVSNTPKTNTDDVAAAKTDDVAEAKRAWEAKHGKPWSQSKAGQAAK